MDDKGISFDAALEKLGGFGKFHFLFLLYLLPSSLTGVLIVNTLTYTMPSVACDFKIPKFRQGFLFSSTYFGMIIGGLIWGAMSDIIGRRRTLLIVLFFSAFSEMLNIFTFDYWGLFYARLCSGFMGSGILTTYYTYSSEFIRASDKYKVTMGVGMLTAMGFFVQALIALFTLPLYEKYEIIPNVLVLNNWKLFQLVCALFPTVAFFLFLFTLPESPAFLLRNGREKEALDVLRIIYAKNTNKPKETFDVKKLYIEEDVHQMSEVKPSFRYRLNLLFSYPYLTPVILMVLCDTITMGTYAGVRPYLSTLIITSLGAGQKKGINMTNSQNQPLCELFKTQVIFTKKVDCSLGNVNFSSEIYITVAIVGFFICTSFLPMIAFVRKFGDTISFAVLHCVGAACVSVMPFARAYVTVILLAMYAVCMQNCLTLCVTLIVGRVPTIVRGVTISLLLFGGRLGVTVGDMILPVMSEFSCPVAFWSIGILNLMALPLILLYTLVLQNSGLDGLSEPHRQEEKSPANTLN